MIVPATKLLWLVGGGLVPFATLATLAPQAWGWCLAPIAALAIAATLDARRGQRQQHHIRAHLPDRVRLFVGRPGRLELMLETDNTQLARSVRVGIPWPPSLEPKVRELTVQLPRHAQKVHVAIECTGRRRGHYAIGACHLEAKSPWGLWSIRSRHPQTCEVLLYPELLRERRRVAALFLNRGSQGGHRHRVVGKGREFEKLRDYAPGDSYDDIHWKATARRGRPVTKLYQVERTQEVYVVLDTSRLSGRPFDPNQPALEQSITGALILALAAQRQGDRFGLILFADRVQGFLRASHGAGHFNACRELLLGATSREVAPDFDELFAFARVRLRHRALLVVLTALDDPILAESFEHAANLVRRQHLVLVHQLQPPGVAPLFTGSSPDQVDEIYQRLAGHLRWHDLRQLQLRLQRRGVRLASSESGRLCPEVVKRYLEVKQLQRL